MTSSFVPRLLYAVLLLLFVLHTDLWLWNDPSRVLGLPIGLTYHLAFCVVMTCVFWLLVRHAWPDHLAPESVAEDERGRGSE